MWLLHLGHRYRSLAESLHYQRGIDFSKSPIFGRGFTRTAGVCIFTVPAKLAESPLQNLRVRVESCSNEGSVEPCK